jgi:MFS family permease
MMRMQFGGILGYAIFGWLADRFGRRPILSLFGILMALGVLPPTILWRWAHGTSGVLSAAFFIAGVGTGTWAGVGPMISELLPTKVRNAALGLLLNVTRGIQFFTPLVITWLSPQIGFPATLAVNDQMV